MNELNLSIDERRVLLFAGATDEQLNQGLLSNSQKQMLEAMRQAKTYLEKRYPENEFEFLSVNVSAPLKFPFVFTARSTSMPDDSFAIRVVYDKDAETQYIVTESYYSDLKKDELYNFIEHVFLDFGLKVKAKLSMDGLYGSEYDPKLPVSELMMKGLNFGVSGWVYVTGPADIDQYVSDVKEKLLNSCICGGFRLMLVEGIDLDEQIKLGAKDKRYITKEVYVSLYAEEGGEE